MTWQEKCREATPPMSSKNTEQDKANTSPQANPGTPQSGSSDIPEFVNEEVYTFWTRYGKTILIAGSTILLTVIALQSWNAISAASSNKLANEFNALESSENYASFIENHPSAPQSSFLLLKLAKENYETGNYQEAADYYEEAAAKLDIQEFQGLALLGQAASLDNLGNTSDSETIYRSIVDSETLGNTLKSEALFKLAILVNNQGNESEFDELIAELEAIDATGVWVRRLASIRNY